MSAAVGGVLGQNRAIRYGVGVGREGFTWSGTQTVTRPPSGPIDIQLTASGDATDKTGAPLHLVIARDRRIDPAAGVVIASHDRTETTGGTDTHLALIDLTPLGVTGRDADEALERAAITCNKNGIPNDPLPPVKTSGIRVGSPAGTTRGFGPAEFREIGNMVADVLDGLRKNGEAGDAQVEANVRERVRALCERFPIYPERF